MDGETLVVQPDTPFLRSYRADYVNLSRQMHGTVSTNTQIATGSSALHAGTGSGGLPMGGNLSTTRIENQARNQFWETLERNIQELLRETDKLLPEGTSETITENQSSSAGTSQPTLGGRAPQGPHRSRRGVRGSTDGLPASTPTQSQSNSLSVVRRSTVHEAASVIVHRESGVITVRATSVQHEKVQEFLDRVLGAAHRQVMIEATILEVALSDGYRQGIDWTRLFSADRQLSLASPAMGGVPGAAASVFSLGYTHKDSLEATIRLLESFGTVKVLSSPKLAVLNNQTAVIKVVEEFVYFTVRADTTQGTNSTTLTTVSTTPQAVSVGLVMSITPQISPAEEVILNIRPTISSISDFRRDPNPNIPATIPNLVPQIRTREIESLLRLGNGETAVLGGLMEDRIDHRISRVPVLGAAPGLGELFTQRDQSVQKTELVIFLRPRVVNAPQQLAGGGSLPTLPDPAFFQGNPARKGW
jgi:general secretion pathway protein D